MNAAIRPWLSAHVFLSDPVRSERYLRERLEPTIQRWRGEGLLDRWFFIRYWEGGPHLRIRLAGAIAADASRVEQALSEDIAAFRADEPPTREAYYREHAFDGREVAVDELPWYGEGTVALIDYQPEIARYGGDEAIEASEELFDLSSRIALGLCKATQDSRSARLSSAYALMAAAVLACGEELPALATYFERYGSLWLSMVGREALEAPPPRASEDQIRLLQRLEQESLDGWGGNSVHAVWGAGVHRLAERLRALHEQGRLISPYDGRTTTGDEMRRHAVLGIVGSQIHMLNNRLGIPSAGELLLARLLAGAAKASQQQDTVA